MKRNLVPFVIGVACGAIPMAYLYTTDKLTTPNPIQTENQAAIASHNNAKYVTNGEIRNSPIRIFDHPTDHAQRNDSNSQSHSGQVHEAKSPSSENFSSISVRYNEARVKWYEEKIYPLFPPSYEEPAMVKKLGDALQSLRGPLTRNPRWLTSLATTLQGKRVKLDIGIHFYNGSNWSETSDAVSLDNIEDVCWMLYFRIKPKNISSSYNYSSNCASGLDTNPNGLFISTETSHLDIFNEWFTFFSISPPETRNGSAFFLDSQSEKWKKVAPIEWKPATKQDISELQTLVLDGE